MTPAAAAILDGMPDPADLHLCVPRILSTALASRVALPASGRDDHGSCACGSRSSWSRG